jgi:hypothetical protein
MSKLWFWKLVLPSLYLQGLTVSAGSEDDISNAGTLDANLYTRSIPIDVAEAAEAAEADDILYYDILHKANLKINT